MAEARPDALVLAMAARRHGVITTPQLAQAGLSKDAVAGRVGAGWLRRLHRGVYLVGPLEAPLTRAMAAVAAYGDAAFLSHATAAVLWGLRLPEAGVMHVTVSGRPAHGREGIHVHRARLHWRDVTQRNGIPVTSPARTLLDLAATIPTRDLARAVEEAQIHRLASDRSLNEQFSRYPRHRGTGPLKRARRTDPALTRSEAERRLLELIRAARLPTPEANARLNGYEVDFLWRDHNLIVEVDGYAFHSSRSSFERDRRRDAEMAAAGWRVVRVTWRQLTEEPEAVIAALAAALAS
jgi:very-short-patch-repair endonuclease